MKIQMGHIGIFFEISSFPKRIKLVASAPKYAAMNGSARVKTALYRKA